MNSDTSELERELAKLLAAEAQRAVDAGGLTRDMAQTQRQLRDSYEALCGGEHDARNRPI